MSGFEHEIISMDDLQSGFGKDLLAEADVIIAVDADAQEEPLFGKWDWELAAGTAHEAQLSVVRIELEVSDDVDELKEIIDTVRSPAQGEEDATEPADDDDG
jgi:hypothetical protein